ncbi:MAG: TetR/AcrR family transcriptional regulator, partial [Stackebrandtia sp.]
SGAGARQFPRDFEGDGSPALAPVVGVVAQGMDDGVLRRDNSLEVTIAITSAAMGLSDLYLGGRIGLSANGFRALCRRSVERILAGLHS